MTTLIAIADGSPPYLPGMLEEELRKSPVLLLASARRPRQVILYESVARGSSDEWHQALSRELPAASIERRPFLDQAPMDSHALGSLLAQELLSLRADFPKASFETAVDGQNESWLAAWQHAAREVPVPLRVYRATPQPYVEARRPALECLVNTLPNTTAKRLQQSEVPLLEDVVRETGCIGDHPKYLRAVDLAAELAPHAAPVCLRGEEGSGRQTLARLIHRLSRRREYDFISVDLGLLPSGYAEMVLFGYQKGAFPEARHDHIGKAQLADKGTLFISGIENVSATVQEQILVLLRQGLIRPLGSTRPLEAQVRLIFGREREQMGGVSQLHRIIPPLRDELDRCEIVVPSLRERPTDAPKIALHLLSHINTSLKIPKQLTREALDFLEHQTWPRNIDDLRVLLERTCLYKGGNLIEPADLELQSRNLSLVTAVTHEYPLPELGRDFALENFISRLRSRLMQKAIDEAGGNQSEAARLLKVSPQAVNQFLKKKKRY